MTLICVDPRTHAAWQQLIDHHPFSSVFHSPQWISALADTYGFDMQAYILLDDNQEPVAGVPFCRMEDMRGARIATPPYSDFCDPLVSTEAEWQAISAALLADGAPLSVRSLHNTLPLADGSFREAKHAMWHSLSLKPDLDTLWNNLDSAARRAVRKAEKEGVRAVIASDPAQMRHFFELHMGIRKYKYGMLAQPYSLFENIWRRLFDQHGFLLMATHGEHVIGTVVYLMWQGTLVYKFSASSADHLDKRPTDLLIWEGIKYGHEHGLKLFDFGLSDADQDGLIRYKRKFADDEKVIHFLVANEPQTHDPAKQQAGAMLGELTRLFTRQDIPDAVTEKAGELLYRYFG